MLIHFAPSGSVYIVIINSAQKTPNTGKRDPAIAAKNIPVSIKNAGLL